MPRDLQANDIDRLMRIASNQPGKGAGDAQKPELDNPSLVTATPAQNNSHT